MRGGIVAVGVILACIGILMYIYGNNLVQEVERYDIGDIPFSELSSELRSKRNVGQTMSMFGFLFAFVGVIVCIAGIAAPSKVPKVKSNGKMKKPVSILGEVIEEFKEKNKKVIEEDKKDEKKSKVDDEAIKILRQRYAKGEITKEEYEEAKKALEEE